MAEVDTIEVLDRAGVVREVATISGLKKLIGEVQANPTANSLLERVKALKTAVDAVATAIVSATGPTGSGVETGSPRVTLPTDRFGTVVESTPVLSTGIYAPNDILFVPIEVPNFFHHAGGSGKICSIEIIDKDDETAVAVDLCFLNASGSLGGNVNDPYAPADAVGGTMVLDRFQIAAVDWVDHGAFKCCNFNNIGHKVRAAAGQTSIWLGAVLRSGTPTYANATDWVIKIGVDWD